MGVQSDRGLVEFRQGLYSCFRRWGDALFELCDAALCANGPVGSVPQLSLEPEFTRSHGSLYKALAKGRIDDDRLRRLLVASAPDDWPMVYAVDASTWDRCDAECSPERGFYYSASRHSAGQPIVAGWSFQWICQLSFTPDSWTAPLDVQRISPLEDATDATIAQIHRLVDLLPNDREVPLFVFDAGYHPIALADGLRGSRAQVLCRIRDDRVFYTDPPARPRRPTRTGGRPPRHGRRMKCSDKRTWGKPSERLVTSEPRYGTVTVTAWHGLHPKLTGRGRWAGHPVPPIVKGTVIRVEVEHLPKPSARTKNTLWLFWSGPGTPDLAGAPTCDASTSSTCSASPRTPSGRPHQHCARPPKPSAGRGSSPPCSPSSASPETTSSSCASGKARTTSSTPTGCCARR